MADRTRALLDAGIALTSELTLDALLQKLVETAASLTGARYAALGVIDPTGRELERFITHGIDAETHAAIGDLPRGRGILGVLIRDAAPLRLHDLAEDPRSVGFPPNHPPMRTFLGVPVLLRGVAYGNLYLTEKDGGEDFTDEDQEVVMVLAGQAAVAIENARLYESARRWTEQLHSLIDMGNALARETDLDKALALVAGSLRELISARLILVLLRTAEGDLRIAAAQGDRAEELLGVRVSAEASKAGKVLDRKQSELVDSVIEDPEIDRELARRMEMNTGLYVPMLTRDEAIGVIHAVDKLVQDRRFTNEDRRLAEIFSARAAVAVDQSRRIERDAFRRMVEAQELERRRLARELHDETGQALTSILLGLSALEGKEGTALSEATAGLRDLVVETLNDVRRLAVELRPTALDDFGLVPALERLTTGFSEQTGIAVDLQSGLREDERLSSEVETVFYRIVQEALTNVVKHAHAEHVSVVLTRKERAVNAVIEDDGRGMKAVADGGLGLVGMRERVALVEGRLEIESSDAGTTLVVEVPLP
jgi:signal transduction histidine kinase